MAFPNWHVLSARAESNNVSIQCREGSMRVFGATVPVSVEIGEGTVKSFMAHLPKGVRRGLIAVCVYLPGGPGGAVLVVERDKAGRAYVNLEEPWIPSGTRLVQLDAAGFMVTDVESGERFAVVGKIVPEPGYVHVPDGNLLLRYAEGTATPDEVRAAATAQAEGQSTRERLENAERDLAALRVPMRRYEHIEAAARMVRDRLVEVRDVLAEKGPLKRNHFFGEILFALNNALDGYNG